MYTIKYNSSPNGPFHHRWLFIFRAAFVVILQFERNFSAKLLVCFSNGIRPECPTSCELSLIDWTLRSSVGLLGIVDVICYCFCLGMCRTCEHWHTCRRVENESLTNDDDDEVSVRNTKHRSCRYFFCFLFFFFLLKENQCIDPAHQSLAIARHNKILQVFSFALFESIDSEAKNEK